MMEPTLTYTKSKSKTPDTRPTLFLHYALNKTRILQIDNKSKKKSKKETQFPRGDIFSL